MKYSCSCFQPLALTVKKPKGTFLTSRGCLKIEFSKNYPNNKAVKIQSKPDFHGFYLTFQGGYTLAFYFLCFANRTAPMRADRGTARITPTELAMACTISTEKNVPLMSWENDGSSDER